MVIRHSVEFEFYLETDVGEITFQIKAEWTPGSRGYTSGPPEKCYPPEPSDVEILKISTTKGVEIPQAEWAACGIDDAILEDIEREADEKGAQQAQDAYEDAQELKMDCLRDEGRI